MRKEFSVIHHKTEIYIHFTIISIALFIFIIIYQIYLTKSTQHTLHPFPFHNCSELYSFYTKISETNYHLWLKLLNSRSSYLKTEETEITEWHLNQEPHNSEPSLNLFSSTAHRTEPKKNQTCSHQHVLLAFRRTTCSLARGLQQLRAFEKIKIK
jgi:hypothetical protein